jgi:hypothetical protein
MAHLYANENFPLPAVEELRRLGVPVLTMAEAGQAGQAMSDEAVLAYAQQEDLALLTLNRKHFVRMHRIHPDHPGIIVCSFDPDFSRLAQRIRAAIMSHESMRGQLIRINRSDPGGAAT